MFDDIITKHRRRIIYCKKCKQYYFSPPHKDCPVCNGSPKKRVNLFDKEDYFDELIDFVKEITQKRLDK